MYSELATRPNWQRGSRTRLIASLGIAALLIATFIITTKFAKDPEPVAGIEVTLTQPRVNEVTEPPLEELDPLLVEETVRELPALTNLVTPVAPDAPPEEPEPVSRDWYTAMSEVAADVIESQGPHSVNPAFDARRRAAAEQFRPSRAPVEKPTWENVERDQLGRRILVHGDCQRVIDDPNVGSNEFFRTFGQYIVSCSNYQRPGQELPWVDEIRDRRVYLQPDPEVRGAARSEVVADLR